MTRALLLAITLPLVASCQKNESPRDARPALPPALRNLDAARPPVPEIAEAVDAVPSVPIADVVVVTPDAGATPARTFEGPGVSVSVGASGDVTLRATDIWDAAVDQTYESCVYVRNALPQLRRSLPAPVVEVVVRACGNARPGERVPTLRPPPAARPAAR